jgi:CBS domain-containing protein/uncharacterized protein (DUF2267 family)
MSLKWYRRPRLVALNANTPVLEAARAIENNNIGGVVVQNKGRVVGIVTDRDLATRVVGQGLDPKTTLLSEIMTTPVVTLSPSDSQRNAIRFMRERSIRRIPLVEGERLVGIVTLDDLLLDEAAPLEALATVVERQIGEGGPAPSDRSPAAQRSAARAEATYRRLLNQVSMDSGLEKAEEAETALTVILNNLMQRLTPDEAKDVIAQLPSMLQPALYGLPLGPDRSITKETIEAELSRRLGLERERSAQILASIGSLIAQSISAGQMSDVRGQLPEDLRGVFSEARASAA